MARRLLQMKQKQFVSDKLLEIVSIGHSIFDPIHAEKEHIDKASELIHILKGSVTVKTKYYSISAKTGDTIYTPANIPHRDIFPPGSIFEVYLFQFHWAEEKDILHKFSPIQLNKVSCSTKSKIANLCRQIYNEFTSSLPFSRQLTSLHLLEILYTFSRESALDEGLKNIEQEEINKSRRRQIMKDAKEFIHQNFNRPISLEDIAESLDISSYYLSRVFSSESGFTLSSYLTRIRMEQAAELMKDNRLNISEIAHKVGYNDSHYFSKVFKLYFKSSPKTYRTILLAHNQNRK